MLRLLLEPRQKEKDALTVLCLGAHCDDIEIGCGGTLLRLFEEQPQVAVHWVVFSSTTERRLEASMSAALFLQGVKQKTIRIHSFRDSFFPYHGAEIKEAFEQLKREVSPDVVFTHFRQDLHQDHALISQLTWNTFRDHLLLEYECPKYDGDLGNPNVYVPLQDRHAEQKIQFILESFQSQAGNHWFSRDVFLSLLKLRGIESNAPQNCAEAFYCRKLVLHPALARSAGPVRSTLSAA